MKENSKNIVYKRIFFLCRHKLLTTLFERSKQLVERLNKLIHTLLFQLLCCRFQFDSQFREAGGDFGGLRQILLQPQSRITMFAIGV